MLAMTGRPYGTPVPDAYGGQLEMSGWTSKNVEPGDER